MSRLIPASWYCSSIQKDTSTQGDDGEYEQSFAKRSKPYHEVVRMSARGVAVAQQAVFGFRLVGLMLEFVVCGSVGHIDDFDDDDDGYGGRRRRDGNLSVVDMVRGLVQDRFSLG